MPNMKTVTNCETSTELQEYRVYLSSLLPNKGDTGLDLVEFIFDCMAEDEAHAEEQAQNAYPDDMVECVELKYVGDAE